LQNSHLHHADLFFTHTHEFFVFSHPLATHATNLKHKKETLALVPGH